MEEETRKKQLELYEQHQRLAYHLAHKFHRQHTFLDRDDLTQTALMALWRAIQKWLPTRGMLSTYAHRCICCQLVREKNKSHWLGLRAVEGVMRGWKERLPEQIGLPDDDSVTRAVTPPDRQVEIRDQANYLLRSLYSDQHRRIVRAVVMEGERKKDVVKRFGMSKYTVWSVLHEAMRHREEEVSKRCRGEEVS